MHKVAHNFEFVVVVVFIVFKSITLPQLICVLTSNTVCVIVTLLLSNGWLEPVLIQMMI